MSDPALEKLFEEIRLNHAEQLAIHEGRQAIREASVRLGDRETAARQRDDLLKRTLAKHIYEQTPVLQAKMQAHEDADKSEFDRDANPASFGSILSAITRRPKR